MPTPEVLLGDQKYSRVAVQIRIQYCDSLHQFSSEIVAASPKFLRISRQGPWEKALGAWEDFEDQHLVSNQIVSYLYNRYQQDSLLVLRCSLWLQKPNKNRLRQTNSCQNHIFLSSFYPLLIVETSFGWRNLSHTGLRQQRQWRTLPIGQILVCFLMLHHRWRLSWMWTT